MLTRLKLENFKSWRNLDIELAPLTMLFGTNSSGKTAILQSLLLLKQTANNVDIRQQINLGGSERDYVDLGGYRELVFEHKVEENINIHLEWQPPSDILSFTAQHHAQFDVVREQLQSGLARLSYDINWQYLNNEVAIQHLEYDTPSIEDAVLHFVAQRTDEGQYLYSLLRKGASIPYSLPPANGYVIPTKMRIDVATGERAEFEFVDYYTPLFEKLMTSIAYLGPMRLVPRRNIVWTDVGPNIIESDGNNTISALIDAEQKRAGLIQEVTKWLSRLGLIDELQIEPLDIDKRFYETKVKSTNIRVFASLLDVGFGVSQVLPVVTLLFFAPEGSIILLEQPELHLHPNAQAVLADLLLEVAETRKLQLIVESHSEHLLRRLQRRIAETENSFANPDNIKMYFCAIEDGESKAHPVEVDQYGQINNWPENFFGDILDDLDKMTRAGLSRRRQELEHSG